MTMRGNGDALAWLRPSQKLPPPVASRIGASGLSVATTAESSRALALPTVTTRRPLGSTSFVKPPAPLSAFASGAAPWADADPADVAAFLVWTAEPKLESRHQYGWAVLFFLLVGTVLGYLSYQNIWAEAKRKVAPVGPLDPANKSPKT